MSSPKRGELYVLKKTDPAGKRRIVVIVSNDSMNRGNEEVLAVPFYSQQLDKRKGQAWCAFFHTNEGGLKCDCVAKADQLALIRKLDINLAAGPIGSFDAGQMERVMAAVKHVLVLT